MRRFFLVIGMMLCALYSLAWVMHLMPGKVTKKQDTDKVQLLHADRLYYNQYTNREAQFLVGNVRFEHQGALMYCDSALYYEATKSFDAFGHVKMVQGDTLSLTGDILHYRGFERMAYVGTYQNEGVVLRHRQTTLYTDSLVYDRVSDMGYFPNRGRLVDKDNELTSDWGQYSPSTRDAQFNYNVQLLNPRPPKEAKSKLLSDTLSYNTLTGVAHVKGPSNLYHGDNTRVYTTNGYYYSHTDEAFLYDRSILDHVAKRLVGDTLHYDGRTHDSKAFGHIDYDDYENKNKFYGHYALYNDSTGYAEASDSALCIDYSQRDTLYCHADTFKVFTYHIDTDSVYRVMHAYRHVRAFRVDMQAVCDSLVFDGKDTCMTMYKDPIVWQQGQQILGEEIKAWANDSTLDSVYVINQALLVERIDSMHYNQVASKEMHSYFRDGEVWLNVADLNVLINYHPFDSDSLMIGMVHAESTQLKMYMKDRKVQRIWMPGTTGQMYPVDQTPANMRFLENFAWFDYIRPLHKDDVFEWRGKKSGTELKESVRHIAPQQKLSNIKRIKKHESVHSKGTP